MEKAAACSVCGERTHISRQCSELGVPSSELSMQGAVRGQHDDDALSCTENDSQDDVLPPKP